MHNILLFLQIMPRYNSDILRYNKVVFWVCKSLVDMDKNNSQTRRL